MRHHFMHIWALSIEGITLRLHRRKIGALPIGSTMWQMHVGITFHYKNEVVGPSPTAATIRVDDLPDTQEVIYCCVAQSAEREKIVSQIFVVTLMLCGENNLNTRCKSCVSTSD